MIASHNTMSYQNPSKWWMWLVKPWTQCQEKDIFSQYENNNVRYFDIRIRPSKVDGNFEPHYCHNTSIYEQVHDFGTSYNTDLNVFNGLNYFSDVDEQPIYLRISLDIRKEPKNAEELKTWFLDYVEKLKCTYKHIKFDSIKIFWEAWSIDYGPQEIKVIEKHWSVNKKSWWEFLLPIKLYQRFRMPGKVWLNEEQCNSNNTAYMYDFVNL